MKSEKEISSDEFGTIVEVTEIYKSVRLNTDYVKELINKYLAENPLTEKWTHRTYERWCVCLDVTGIGYVGLEYATRDVGEGEDPRIDEDLPYCDKFNKFLKDLSKKARVRLQVPCGYYSK